MIVKKIFMSFLTIIFVLIIIGFALWVINTKVPMDGTIKVMLNLVVVFGVLVWLLKATGVWHQLPGVH